MSTISAAFLVKDPPIGRMALLVDYLRPVVDDIVIVDTGSDTDIIDKMSRWSGTTVIQAPWENDFAKARNAGLGLCKREWTLIVDPDELPSYGMMRWLEGVNDVDFNPMSALGFLFWTKNFWDGNKGAELEYHWHCRLFKTGRGQFYRPVHELVKLDGKDEPMTRDTPLMPRAPRSAYLIHSKDGEDIEKSDVLYNELGGTSR